MNGLELSREYFETVARPSLQREFPELYERIAAGLVGNGSECFGFDDLISRDHDWGIDFHIWTLEEDRKYLPELIEWKSKLFSERPPEFTRERSEYGAEIGVTACGDFYKKLIGVPSSPESLIEWRRVPEENFALAVNGEVFLDGPHEFTRTREALLEYYPEDLRRKKIATRLMAIAQTGQYNLARTIKRGDYVTASLIKARFANNVISLVFALNRTFMPFYKWSYRKMKGLPILGGDASSIIGKLLTQNACDAACDIIERLCEKIIKALKAQNLSDSDETFLTVHAEQVRSSIKDEFLRSLPAQYE